MTKLTSLLSIVSLFGCISITAHQPQTAPRIDIKRLGPQVGERLPDFQLQDQSGKTWTLNSLLGPKGAVVVFHRSADW